MNKYMLITVWDRNISTLLFPTKKDAQKAMQEEMIKYGNIPKEAFYITNDMNEDWAFTEDSFKAQTYRAVARYDLRPLLCTLSIQV